jgi:hypothetical protein
VDTYDEYCVFPHIVALDDDQVGYLAYQAHRHRPRKPFYVCELQGANIVEQKAKMVSKLLL